MRRAKKIIKDNIFLFGASFLHFMIDGFSVALYPLLPLIARDFKLSLSKVGTLRTAYSFSTSFLQLPISVLFENSREMIVLIAGMIWIAGGYIFMGFSNSYIAILLVSIIAGLGGNMQHPIGSAFISKIYEGKRSGGALGILNFSGDVGKVLYPIIVSIILIKFSWKYSIVLLGSVGVIISLILLAIYIPIDAELNSSEKGSGNTKKKKRFGNGWGIESIPKFIILSIIGILDAMSRMVMLTYLPFLLIQKGVKPELTGIYLTVLLTGGAAGRLGCGIMSDRFGYYVMIIITEILTSVTILTVYFATKISFIFFILFLCGFFLNGTSTVLYVTVAEFVSREKRTRGYGLFYTIYLIAEAIAPMIFGYVGERESLGMIYYSLSVLTLLIIPLVYALKKVK